MARTPAIASSVVAVLSAALASGTLHDAVSMPSGLAGAIPGPFSAPPAAGSLGAGAQPLWPEQIHITYTGRPGEHVVEWVSGAPRGTSMVQISDEPGCCDTLHCGCFPYWW